MTSNSDIDSDMEVPDVVMDDMSPKAVARWLKNQGIPQNFCTKFEG